MPQIRWNPKKMWTKMGSHQLSFKILITGQT